MTNPVDRNNTHHEDGLSYFSWLEGYLEQLTGEEIRKEFQEHHYETPEYYELVAALMG
jgi:hypothetical protein